MIPAANRNTEHSMNKTLKLKLMGFAALGLALAGTASFAQTDGGAKLETTLLDYNGSSMRHWTVVWVTKADGTFIKSLRKQGPSWTSTHWDSHCAVWNTARGGSASGSQSLDGYSSATAQDYGVNTNNPIIWTWNCRDASNVLVPDGAYKFWVQYAEDSGQGPYTTSGLQWTKGPSAATTTYPNQGANFSNMRVTWTPVAPPAFTSVQVSGNSLIMNGTGPANGTYTVLTSTDASAPTAQWTPVVTNPIGAAGTFTYTTTLDPGASQKFYRLRAP